MSIVIAGERSGVGKTTVTLSLLAYLSQIHASHRVQSFKVGPDYIDPMFHRHVTGRACRNLDPVLTSEAYVQSCFAEHSRDADYALIEGVMGLFDGATGCRDLASTAHIARLLHLPILLVLDCSRLSRSIAAIAHGYTTFDPQLTIAGVVLNRVGSDRHLELLQDALAPLHLPILGVLRRHDDITIPDRHLGLVPTGELPHLNDLVDRLAQMGATWFDWSRLLPLLQTTPSTTQVIPPTIAPHHQPVAPGLKIAIAQDHAFNFYYQDNLDQLADLGAELVTWSPLADAALPIGTSGLYLGGGFPELFAAELAENQAGQRAVLAAIQAGMPTYAECGGLMYLCDRIIDFAEQSWQMVGVFPAAAQMATRLTLGYRQATALCNSPLVSTGTSTWGHEFHRSHLDRLSSAPLYQLHRFDAQDSIGQEGWRSHQVHASYIHLHWGATPQIPARFLQHCATFSRSGMA